VYRQAKVIKWVMVLVMKMWIDAEVERTGPRAV
jgi:hypothetical protein